MCWRFVEWWRALTRTEDEIGRLERATADLVDVLLGFDQRMRPLGDTSYVMHGDYSARAESLGRYLHSAQILAEKSLYSPAFAVLRCALEHHLVDHLFLMATRYVLEGHGVSREKYEEWDRQWQEGAPGTETIESMEWQSGHLRLIREGPFVNSQSGERLYPTSIYYSYLENFNPFVGLPDEQADIEDSPWRDVETLEQQAEEHRRIWHEAFKWKSIKANLELNGLYTAEQLVRLNVHYRFLSAFVHLTQQADSLVHPFRTVGLREELREHVARELTHLYVAAIGAREIEVLLEVSDRPPAFGLEDRQSLEQVAEEARAVSAHLWFPGDDPHPIDEHQRATRERAAVLSPGGDESSPGIDRDDREVYYRNPFRRLERMHRAGTELTTGETYRPTFF